LRTSSIERTTRDTITDFNTDDIIVRRTQGTTQAGFRLLDKTQDRIMTRLKAVLTLAAAAVVVSTFAPAEASGRWRRHPVGCFDRLPAYGYDGCGLREFSYGLDSCWLRREAYTRHRPRATRVWICG
jgi:hypothetical protein